MSVNFPFVTGPFKDRKKSARTPFSGKIPNASKSMRMTPNSGENKMRNDFGMRNMKAAPAKGANKTMMSKGGSMKVSKPAAKAQKSCRKIKSK